MEKETKIIKYLYVDDNVRGRQSIQNFLEKNVLAIDVIKPKEKRKDILNMLTEYDGLIVDQQLDEKPNSDGNLSDYLGSSLAIDIRIKENETSINSEDISLPIILFSANPNVPTSLYGLGDELFDIKIFKSRKKFKEFKTKIPVYKTQMISLVNGYNELKALKKSQSSVCDSLKLGNNLGTIDNRIIDELRRRDSLAVHSKASFILNELIIKQGVLVDEDVLAVRLGINKNKSQEGWQEVLSSLNKFGAKYDGVFCEGWSRWWMPMVEKWWSEVMKEDTYLQFLSASRRVQIISEKLKIKVIVASAKSKFSDNDAYWTVCASSKEPLAIENGLMLSGQDNLYPWQDAVYVSIMSAIEGTSNLNVADFEKERLEYYQNILNRSRK